MVQNLKLDVIYHKAPSDFEMEFNLCGCCRMRLLNDKTTDKKTFLKALVRDVARSRVIICCGPLFGADGLINMVGKAIGNGTSLCDNKTYGINSDEEINIINGSTPLVTPDGYFGGCIIESGPQTIILLTENKGFRKAIMQTLIHPYLEEISYIPGKSTVAEALPPEEEIPTISPEDEAFITQPDAEYGSDSFEENAYEAAVAQTDEHNIDFIMDNGNETEEAETTQIVEDKFDNAFDKMYTEVESPDEIKSRYKTPYVPSESDKLFISDSQVNDDEKQTEGSNTRSLDITIIVLVLLILLAVLALAYFVVLKPITMGIGVGEYIKQIFGITKVFVGIL